MVDSEEGSVVITVDAETSVDGIVVVEDKEATVDFEVVDRGVV